MPRLLFEKTGSAVWISHLDLMRVFQRAFKRAGLPLTHTHGFNPRPSVSIALPLSVGVSSVCELLDFELDTENEICNAEICDRINKALVDGVRVLEVYGDGRKIRDLCLLHCQVEMVYDNGVPHGACVDLEDLFKQEEIVVPKKTKSGIQDQNIAAMIRRISVIQESEDRIILDALVCCQNPTLNPMQLSLAVTKYLPNLKSDFSRCHRLEIYDVNENVFR